NTVGTLDSTSRLPLAAVLDKFQWCSHDHGGIHTSTVGFCSRVLISSSLAIGPYDLESSS
ncbi:hypothetical protein HAX54_011185, partial [Datura stramonium]|nr:hypothetical protein [Datura stramonium]